MLIIYIGKNILQLLMGKNESGITIKTGLKNSIEQFIKNHPEKGMKSVPDALRIAWDRYSTEQKLIELGGTKSIKEMIDAIENIWKGE